MTDILMPRLSDSMEEGTIVKWIASEGDEISEGDELVEIETDKANMVYEADESGTLSEIVAKEGDTVALGEPIAKLGEGGGSSSSDSGEEEEDSGDEEEDESAEVAVDAETDDETGEDEDAVGDGDSDGSEDADEDSSDEDADEDSEDADEEPEAEAKEAEQQPEDEESERGGTNEGSDPSDSGDSGASGGSGPEQEAPRVKASPLARRIASESGVDLSSVKGSGPGGRVLRADVEAAASGGSSVGSEAPAEEKPKADKKAKKQKKDKKPKKDDKDEKSSKDGAKDAAEKPAETAKGTAETIELTRLQQTVARRMSESKATAPHFYLQTEIDMSRAVAARASLKASAREGDPVPSFNDMVVKACAVALGEFPRANAAYKDGRFELYSRINVGIAVAGPDALVVPTIFDADQKGLRQIAADARALAGKVRDKSITPPELSGATFTVSNLGMYGVSNFHAVINSPQAAILAVGAITEKPVIRDGEFDSAHLMGATLACDHRILYGADGAEFLARVRALLEEPVGLAL